MILAQVEHSRMSVWFIGLLLCFKGVRYKAAPENQTLHFSKQYHFRLSLIALITAVLKHTESVSLEGIARKEENHPKVHNTFLLY